MVWIPVWRLEKMRCPNLSMQAGNKSNESLLPFLLFFSGPQRIGWCLPTWGRAVYWVHVVKCYSHLETLPVWATKEKKPVPINILLIRRNAKEDIKLPFCTVENLSNENFSSYVPGAHCTKIKLRDPVLFCDHSIISYDWAISKVWVWTIMPPTQRAGNNKSYNLGKKHWAQYLANRNVLCVGLLGAWWLLSKIFLIF